MGDDFSLEDRISYYEARGQDPGGLRPRDWVLPVLTGIQFPGACLLLGWLVGC